MSNKNTNSKLSKLVLISTSFFCIFSLFGQSLKTYSGYHKEGNATYTYYEDNEFNRILQGDFSFTGYLFNAKGQFSKGKENGKWTIWATDKAYQDPSGKFKVNTIINGNYTNGKFDGLWSYSNSMVLWSNQLKKYETKEDKEISTANFKNNYFIGKLSFFANWPNQLKIEGQFTDSGMLDGTWLIEDNENRHIIKYLNGIAYWRLSQDKSTGEKLVYYDSTAFVNKFWQNFDSIRNISMVNGRKYSTEKIELTRENVAVATYSSYQPRNNIKNPAIFLWTSDEIRFYNYESLTNPLYCYKRESELIRTIRPYCYERIIKEE